MVFHFSWYDGVSGWNFGAQQKIRLQRLKSLFPTRIKRLSERNWIQIWGGVQIWEERYGYSTSETSSHCLTWNLNKIIENDNDDMYDLHVDDGVQHDIDGGEESGNLGAVIHVECWDLVSKKFRNPSDDVNDEPTKPISSGIESDPNYLGHQ